MSVFSLFCFLLTLRAISAALEQVKFSKTLSQDSKYVGFATTLYKYSSVRIKVTNIDCEGSIQIPWVMRSSPFYFGCDDRVQDVKSSPELEKIFFMPKPSYSLAAHRYHCSSGIAEIDCNSHRAVRAKFPGYPWLPIPEVVKPDKHLLSRRNLAVSQNSEPHDRRPKRALSINWNETGLNEPESLGHDKNKISLIASAPTLVYETISLPWIDNIPIEKASQYILIVNGNATDDFSAEIYAEFNTPISCLHTRDFLQKYHATMCVLYPFYLVVWVVMSIKYRYSWRFAVWGFAVFVLELMEHAFIYSEQVKKKFPISTVDIVGPLYILYIYSRVVVVLAALSAPHHYNGEDLVLRSGDSSSHLLQGFLFYYVSVILLFLAQVYLSCVVKFILAVLICLLSYVIFFRIFSVLVHLTIYWLKTDSRFLIALSHFIVSILVTVMYVWPYYDECGLPCTVNSDTYFSGLCGILYLAALIKKWKGHLKYPPMKPFQA